MRGEIYRGYLFLVIFSKKNRQSESILDNIA